MGNDEHYIVAIGASAGGLEAIHEFFDHMPETRNLSFVIIQHLSPDHKSLLVDLVSRHTDMKVFEAENNLPVRKNCIYVIPNNKFITVKHGRLVLKEKLPQTFPNNAVDIFFESLAVEKRSKAIAVVMSGTGTDGTKGIKAIKELGGLVIVQEPTSSKFDGMPNSAITSGNADYVLPVGEIPGQVLAYVTEANNFSDDEDLDDDILDKIFAEIRQQAGFDFQYYKTPTITRRVVHRMRKTNFNSIDKYYEFLKGNPEECEMLGREFLINVTRFFRDPEAFSFLASDVFSQMIREKKPGASIKLWICACSTGEEAYSLAILLDELLIKEGRQDITLKIFATDVEKSNITIAAKGFYPKTIEADVSQERLQQYFAPSNDGYIIHSRIRKQIVFAVHNVIKDPPFIKNDLVSCRNMLIYMNNALQQKIYSILLFSANINGYIFLGPTETPGAIRNYIEELHPKWKIFRKKWDMKVSPILSDIPLTKSREAAYVLAKNGKATGGSDLWDTFKDSIYREFNFAAFCVDGDFEIKEAIGNFAQDFSLPNKSLRVSLSRMLPRDVTTTVISEIRKCREQDLGKVVKNLRFQDDNKDYVLQLLIQPEGRNKLHTLVAFNYMAIDSVAAPAPAPAPLVPPDNVANDYVLSLEEELSETRGNLQYAVEDLETANEELQSSNEELMSANEELQSSNEELQSLNEELHTLNTEHQVKIKELIELNDDLTNYFRSSNIGQIFLDKNLIIRKFNPASVRIVNLIDNDVGRPITHISTNIRYEGFIQDIESVLTGHVTIEKEVQLQSGVNLLLRIMPYITRERATAGVVISFFDITTVTNLNNIIRGVFNSTLSAIFALKAIREDRKNIIDFLIETTNYAGGRVLKGDPDVLKGKRLKKDLKATHLEGLFTQLINVVEKDKTLHTDFYDEPAKAWYEVTGVKNNDGLVVTFTDITQKKTAEERLRKNYAELITTRENLKKLNAELEAKVADRTRLLSESEERFRMVSRATNEVIWDWDIVNNKMWVSDAFYARFGHAPAAEITRTAWLNKIHPDDMLVIDRSILNALNEAKTQWTHEYRFQDATGNFRNILDRAYVMQDDYGTPFRMIGSMLDITQLKKAEREIASNVAQRKFLAEAMPFIVWTAAEDGRINFVNRQYEQYTGISPEEALNDEWKEVLHPEDLPNVEALWNESLRHKTDFQVEVRIKLADNSYRWNILRTKVQTDNTGQVVNRVIFAIDIHDQKQINELLERKVETRTKELVRMNHALEASNADLQQFASVASHDLQEPLRKIHFYSNMLEERFASVLGNGTAYLHKIVSASTRMKSIISNVLNYSKLSEENIRFEFRDLNQLITEVLEDVEVAIQEKKATISMGPIPPMDIIPAQMRQVFQNMISNALKFSRPGVPPRINISSERVESRSLTAPVKQHGKFCRIVLEDNGIGFSEEFAHDIFMLFHRLHSKDTYEGTGIGLSIAKKIIEKHGGLIGAQGREGEGAVFTIVLPIHQTASA